MTPPGPPPNMKNSIDTLKDCKGAPMKMASDCLTSLGTFFTFVTFPSSLLSKFPSQISLSSVGQQLNQPSSGCSQRNANLPITLYAFWNQMKVSRRKGSAFKPSASVGSPAVLRRPKLTLAVGSTNTDELTGAQQDVPARKFNAC